MRTKDNSTTGNNKQAGEARRRDAFVEGAGAAGKAHPRSWLLLIPLLIAVAVGAALLTARQAPPTAVANAAVTTDGIGYPAGINSQAPNKRYPVLTADSGGELRLPAGAFADGKARFFTTTVPNGKTINFFVVRSSDGVIRAAFDSCDVCYAAHKGYHQEGDYMVCNNCGQRFATSKINELRGGCNPVPLTRALQGDSVVIKLADLQNENRAENGQPLF